jgi:hypothetical protein
MVVRGWSPLRCRDPTGPKKAPSGATPEGANSDQQSGPSRRAEERNDDNDHENEAEGRKIRRTGGFHEWADKKGEERTGVKAAERAAVSFYCLVIASPAQPDVAIQSDGLLRRSAGQQSFSQ